MTLMAFLLGCFTFRSLGTKNDLDAVIIIVFSFVLIWCEIILWVKATDP